MSRLPVVNKLEEELKKLERELRVNIPQELKKAADHGDLSENAEYDAARERQTYVRARIAHLQSRIQSISSLNIDALPRDRVALGSLVTVEDQDSGEVMTYDLVTPEEVNPSEGKISTSSPVGKALLNKMLDDEVMVKLPASVKEFIVNDIVTIHKRLPESN